MWTKTYSTITKEITKEQYWKVLADVNQWHTFDKEIEYAKMEGPFEKGNSFILRPKGGPNVKIQLIEVIENYKFIDYTKFPLAKMYGEHILEETEEGLKITVTMTMKGVLGFLWIKLVANDIVKNLPKDIEDQIRAAKSK